MLSVSHISFSYSGRPVLDDVTFEIPTGSITALRGPNGAGKTTLMRIMAGVLLPGAGNVAIDGVDSADYPLRYRRLLGYMADSFPLYNEMTVKAFLAHRARLKGERAMRVRRRVSEAAEQCAIDGLLRCAIGRLSQGQRKRVALAEAIMLRPRLLLLDDAIAGIDAESRAAIVSALKSASANSTVVVTGHELAEISAFSTNFIELKPCAR